TASVAYRTRLGRIGPPSGAWRNLLVTASLSSLRLGDCPTEATVAVRVTCQCGTSYELKDEFAGRLVKCPQCGRDNRVPGVAAAIALIGALVALIAVGVGLSAKRHVTFYRDETKRDKLLDVLQDRKWQPITATYTVRDRSGRTMALLWKNYLYNVVRKRWYV